METTPLVCGVGGPERDFLLSIDVRIYRDKGLVLVRYENHPTIEDCTQSFAGYIRHPDFRPGQKQLIDLSAVTACSIPPYDLMKFHARKVSGMQATRAETETLMAFYAPTPQSQKIARLSVFAWEPVSSVIARMFDFEESALAFLGLRERCIADLLFHAD